jgi:hypothetical protein
LISAVAPGTVACSSASSLDGAHADASPPLDSGSAGAADHSSGDTTGPIAASMNDVSILFPLPSSAADIDNLLAPSATGNRGALLPSALYAAIGPIAGSTDNSDGGLPLGPHETIAAYGDLRVVAMRIDPCFASLDPDPLGAGCTAQLRLVFQEVRWSAGAANAADSALHAFYDLARVEFLALARALVELRIENEAGDVLGPLAPHPIMMRQGLAGAMSQGAQRLILEYAGEQNLVRTAQSSLVAIGSSGVWQMSAFDVNSAPLAAIPRAIPTLAPMLDGGSILIEAILAGFGAGMPYFALFGPTTASNDFTALDKGAPTSLSAFDRQAALDALVRVENPKDNSPDTVDCASCHMATPTEKIVATPLFGFDDTMSPLAFQPDGTNVTRSAMEATWAAMFAPNIHAFSYVATSPGISQRVVNETATVVEYLNDLPQ